MKSLRFLLGLVAGLALMLAGLLLEGGSVLSLVDVGAALIVAGGALGSTLIANPLGRLGAAPQGDVEALRAILSAAGRGALLAGFVGALLGAVHVFANLARPEHIGPGVALAFLSVAYGFGFNVFIARPLAEDRHAR